MSIYYCPGCGNCTQYRELFVFFKETRMLILKMIRDGQIKKDEQKLCLICEDRIKRNYKNKIISVISRTSVISSCVECFDLQINGVWQRFTFEQRENLRGAFLTGSLYINGEAIRECPSCLKTKIFARERKENLIMIHINHLMGGKMKKHLIKAVCPVCERRIKLTSGHWRGMSKINKEALPPDLPKERCPECSLDIANKIRLGSPVVIV